MKKRKVKKGPFIALILLIILCIGGFSLYKYIEYRNSNTYKLLEKGYTKEEVPKINKLKNVNRIVEMNYQKNLVSLLDETYFLEKNLDQYLDYKKENPSKSTKDIIAIVNVGTSKPYYEGLKETDTSKKELMLVNKYFKLPDTYKVEKVKELSSKYSYAGNKINEDIYEPLKDMFDAATKDNVKLVVTSGYRSIESQEKIYKNYVSTKGKEWADGFAARPGCSEHESGYAVDFIQMGTNRDTFEASEGFAWLQKHAAEYGFILRYPKDKEYLTGYEYESWHYRYVGEKTATKLKKLNITFDEYSAFYLN
ncbi:MAG: M15 family metallopeptidase [Bacilli bacterium]|nr:M15 family metallopeptidase [Bacilli bacterium]